MTLSVGYGILFAVISLLCNGSFSSLNKLPSVVHSKVNPQIFNLYFIFGCVVSCLIVYTILIGLGETITITYLGIISGFLLSLAGITTFSSIGHIGLSVGVAIWSGTAILVSFIEGLLVDADLYSWTMSIIGIIVLIIGITIVSFSELLAGICCDKPDIDDKNINTKHYSQSQGIPDLNHSHNSSYHHESQTLLTPENIRSHCSFDSKDSSKLRQEQNRNNDEVETNDELAATKWFIGIFYAILTGILGGSIGFPSTWTDSDNRGVKYLISFAIGASMVFPITCIGQCFCRDNPSVDIKWHFKICFIPGFMAGIIWNAGNLASLYAIEILGYSVAYPIMQSSLIIASIWGVFIWKEFTDTFVITFVFLGAMTVIAGCVLITYGVDA